MTQNTIVLIIGLGGAFFVTMFSIAGIYLSYQKTKKEKNSNTDKSKKNSRKNIID